MPVEGVVQITGRLQCSAISAAFSSPPLRLDYGGEAPVQLGAIGLELRFVGDRPNQGWWNAYSGRRVNLTWPMSSAARKSRDDRCDAQPVGRSGLNRVPTDGRRVSVRFALGSSRSMRAAIVACNVAGTLMSASSAEEMYAPRLPVPAHRVRPGPARSLRRRTDCRPRCPAMVWPSPAYRGVPVQQLRGQCRCLGVAKGRKDYRLGIWHWASAPRYSGR